jgi:LacI family transcriptional regulator
MGYRPDLIARSLVKGRTMSIGVIVFDIKNRFFAQLLNSIENEARKRDYFVNITLQEEDPELEIQLINSLVDRRNDGIILCPVNKGDKFAKFISELPIPVVVIGNEISQSIPYIGINEREAAKEATELILSKGYEKVVFVCPPLANKKRENIFSHEQRLEGFLQGVKKHAEVERDIIDHWNFISDAEELLEKASKKTALFCSGDTFALDIIKHFRKIGKKVPRDIGIMGFDGIDTLEYVTPQLATVVNPIDKIGAKAVENLLDLIDGQNIDKHILMRYEVVAGESL